MRLWVLNLDAELELARPAGAYRPTRAVRALVAARRAGFAAHLPPGDLVLDDEGTPREVRPGGALGDARELDAPLAGAAWCPTPLALAALRRAGATPPRAPGVEVLREVNGRRFAASIHALEQDRVCADLPAARAALARPGRWLIKRALSFAGRGQLRVEGGPLRPHDEAWIAAALREGPVLVTPRRTLTLEVALHGALAPPGPPTSGARLSGELHRGQLTRQLVDEAGQHARSAPLDPEALTGNERARLAEVFDRTAAALRAAGYFGPFGVDAFRYRAPDGAAGFHPLSDLNARYTMGWPVGLPLRHFPAGP